MNESRRNKGPLPVLSLQGEALRVESLVPGGRGMGTLADGRKAFVSGAFPGDSLRISSAREKKNYVEVTSFEMERVGSDRIEPRCSFVGECGGCDWMPLSPEAQAREKQSLVRQALLRTGGFEADFVSSILSYHQPPLSWQYRSRVRLQVQRGRVGFFKKATRELVEVPDCAIMSPLLASAMALTRKVVREHEEAFSHVQHLELRVLGEGEGRELSVDSCSAHFSLKPEEAGQSKRRAEALRGLSSACAALSHFLQVRIGRAPAEAQAYEPIAGVTTYAALGAFTQVNHEVNRQLIRRVLEIAREASAKTFLDLYCGSGNFSLPLLAEGLAGVGVEQNAEAISAARRATREQGFEAEFVAEASHKYTRSLNRASSSFDLAVLDPPRAGAKEVLEDLARLRVPLLVLISCDPVTQARDLRLLAGKGYELRCVEAFDMFPQTHHVETLALMQLK